VRSGAYASCQNRQRESFVVAPSFRGFWLSGVMTREIKYLYRRKGHTASIHFRPIRGQRAFWKAVVLNRTVRRVVTAKQVLRFAARGDIPRNGPTVGIGGWSRPARLGGRDRKKLFVGRSAKVRPCIRRSISVPPAVLLHRRPGGARTQFSIPVAAASLKTSAVTRWDCLANPESEAPCYGRDDRQSHPHQ
jgi:hypothetical protein